MNYSIKLTILIILFGSNFTFGKNTYFNKQDTITRNCLVLYVNQPIGFINKARLKIGYKFENKSSLIFSFTNFFNKVALAKFSGFQFCTEYHYMLNNREKGEFFIYGKSGFGNYEFSGEKFKLFSSSSEFQNGSGTYVLIGAGFGEEYSLNRSKTILFQMTQGLKFTKTINENGDSPGNRIFFLFNPGSLIDLNFNFGFKF